MWKVGYDNDKYLQLQSAHIRERLAFFGGKLYQDLNTQLGDMIKPPDLQFLFYKINRTFFHF